MAKRIRMSKGRSRKVFTRAAQRVHPRNMVNTIWQRGGIRL